MTIRPATPADAELIGLLLHDFNTEFDEPTPTPEVLAERMTRLMEIDTAVLLAGDVGLAVLRMRPAIWSAGLEAYLAELYVRPARRGRGLGRALLEAAMDRARSRGADRIELGTSEDDVVARHLYEKCGFIRTEGFGGPLMFVYERDL